MASFTPPPGSGTPMTDAMWEQYFVNALQVYIHDLKNALVAPLGKLQLLAYNQQARAVLGANVVENIKDVAQQITYNAQARTVAFGPRAQAIINVMNAVEQAAKGIKSSTPPIGPLGIAVISVASAVVMITQFVNITNALTAESQTHPAVLNDVFSAQTVTQLEVQGYADLAAQAQSIRTAAQPAVPAFSDPSTFASGLMASAMSMPAAHALNLSDPVTQNTLAKVRALVNAFLGANPFGPAVVPTTAVIQNLQQALVNAAVASNAMPLVADNQTTLNMNALRASLYGLLNNLNIQATYAGVALGPDVRQNMVNLRASQDAAAASWVARFPSVKTIPNMHKTFSGLATAMIAVIDSFNALSPTDQSVISSGTSFVPSTYVHIAAQLSARHFGELIDSVVNNAQSMEATSAAIDFDLASVGLPGVVAVIDNLNPTIVTSLESGNALDTTQSNAVSLAINTFASGNLTATSLNDPPALQQELTLGVVPDSVITDENGVQTTTDSVIEGQFIDVVSTPSVSGPGPGATAQGGVVGTVGVGEANDAATSAAAAAAPDGNGTGGDGTGGDGDGGW